MKGIGSEETAVPITGALGKEFDGCKNIQDKRTQDRGMTSMKVKILKIFMAT